MNNEDLVFLAQHKGSEHFRVLRTLIADSKNKITSAIATAKNSESLLIAQGTIRALIALENTLSTGIYQGEEIIKEIEKNTPRVKKPK